MEQNNIAVPAVPPNLELMGSADSLPAEMIAESNQLNKAWNVVKRSGQTALLMAEILPITNEGSRLAIYGAAIAAHDNPYFAGGALGIATFVIEGVGGVAAASLYNTDNSRKLFVKVNNKAEKLGVPVDRKLSAATKAGWTLMGGTVVGLTLEQREDPTRTIQQNRQYSLFSSAWQGGVLTAVGTLGAKGIDIGIEDPKRGIILAGAVAGVVAVGTKTKKFVNSRRNRKSRNV